MTVALYDWGPSPFCIKVRAILDYKGIEYRRLIRRQVVGQGTGRKSPAQVGADLNRELDAVAALAEPGPFVPGGAPMLCDFALLGQLLYLSRMPMGGPAMQSRPAIGAWLQRMRGLRRA